MAQNAFVNNASAGASIGGVDGSSFTCTGFVFWTT